LFGFGGRGQCFDVFAEARLVLGDFGGFFVDQLEAG